MKCIEASPHDAATAYVVVDNHRMDDYRPHLWKTTDFGKTWTSLAQGLDVGIHCHVIREDVKQKGLLYLGTERGVMHSPNSGDTWKSLQLNLPTVPVHDLVVKENDLVVGTHGRSIWILDDLTPIRESTSAIVDKTAHLFTVQPATRWHNEWAGPTSSFTRHAVGRNPNEGAIVWYHIAKSPAPDVKLEIIDARGTVIATAKAQPEKDHVEKNHPQSDSPRFRKLESKSGLNRFVWDLTHDGAEGIPGAHVDMGNAEQRIPVSPGKYQVRLTVGSESYLQEIEVRPDPRLALGKPAITHIALVEQEKLALRIRDNINTLSDTVRRIRAIKRQIALRQELLVEIPEAKELLKQSQALDKQLDAIEEKLHNPKAKISYDIFAARGGAMLYSQMAWLLTSLTDTDGAPTRAQIELADELEKELSSLQAAFDILVKGDLAKSNDAARKLNIPELYVPPPKKR